MNLGLLETVAKAILGLVALPILIAFYYDQGKRITGSQWAKWSFKNRFFWFVIVLLCIAVFIEVKTYKPDPTVQDKPLEFFPLSAYKDELEAYSQKQQNATWDADKQQLLRKFEYAVYAWKSADLDETMKALVALESGQDQVGSLRRISSFVVSNNLGCVTFKQQRDKEFKAFLFFQTAQQRVGSAEPFKTTIEANLKILDKMVN